MLSREQKIALAYAFLSVFAIFINTFKDDSELMERVESVVDNIDAFLDGREELNIYMLKSVLCDVLDKIVG